MAGGEENGSAQRTRVLIVDDSAVVRRLMCARLQAAGFAVAVATDGRAAVEAIERAPFEVVVTDVAMPRLDGLGLLEQLQRDGAPVVVLLADSPATEAAAAMALRLGAHDYVPKSQAAIESIAAIVRRAAEEWRRRQQSPCRAVGSRLLARALAPEETC